MINNDLWNISVKIKRSTVKINSSVFFFLVVPTIYYINKGDVTHCKIFLESYCLIFLIYFAFKIIINFLKKTNITVYPFGIFENLIKQDTKLSPINANNILTKSLDITICLFLCFFSYISNFSYQVVSYPVFLLLANIFSNFIFNSKDFNFKKKFIIFLVSFTLFVLANYFTLLNESQNPLTFSYLFEHLFDNIEYSILFLSFLYYVMQRENTSELENIGKECFVREIMTSKDYLKTLSPTDTVDRIIDDVVKLPQKIFPVLVNNKIVGIVKKDEIIINFKIAVMNDYPLIEEIMTNVKCEISPESNILIAKKLFEKSHLSSHCIPVVKDGIFMGLLYYELFLEFISIKKIVERIKESNKLL